MFRTILFYLRTIRTNLNILINNELNTLTMDPYEIANFITKEFMLQQQQQFISLDGLSSGVPTQTTPTLTPTTLRNIEQTFIELQNTELDEHQAVNQAGFVPPIVLTTNTNNTNTTSSYISADDTADDISNKSMWTTNSDSNCSNDATSTMSMMMMRPTTPITPQQDNTNTTVTKTRRNGGRRPNKNINMTPEEEQRRNMRRERNKIAAARCRKRRLDHTNALLEETEGLEQKKMALQNEIEELQAAKEELQYVLERHRANCRIQQSFNNINNNNGSGNNINVISGVLRPDTPPDIKPIVYHLIESTDDTMLNSIRIKQEIDNNTNINNTTTTTTTTDTTMNNVVNLFTHPPLQQQQQNNNKNKTTLNALNTQQQQQQIIKPNRPSSLNVLNNTNKVETIAGIAITTPSAALPFNFDSLMEGGTGLTPISGPLLPTNITTNINKNNNNHESSDNKLVSL